MYRTWLIPYLEGGLDAEQRRQVEARLAEDPELRAELAALRRTQPRLRQAALHLRQTDTAGTPAALWPRLRGRLETRPARRFPFGPVLWGAGGLCAAGAILLAIVQGPKTHPVAHGIRTAHAVKSGPLVTFHRDNGSGTVVAEKLRKHAAQVAAEKRAVQPHLAAGRLPEKPLPIAPPPAAPPLPGNLATGKLPMPVTPPVRMAKGEAGRPISFGSDLPPAPTHSPGLRRDDRPLPLLMTAKVHGVRSVRTDNRVSYSEGAAPADRPPLAHQIPDPVPPAPTASPRPAPSGGGFGGGGFGGGGFGGGASPDNSVAAAAPLHTFSGSTVTDGPATAPSTLRQRLERTVTQPLYGTTEGAQEEQRLLQDAQQAGTLEALAGQLEQAPVSASRAAQQELLLGRMRAAVYETEGDLDRALTERRAVALLATADGEDWFRLAQMEARLGNTASAQRAYAQALRAPGTALSSAHRATAHRNLP